MFYFSRGEQAALLLLAALLLGGAGVLVYARGQHSAYASASDPVFVPAAAQATVPETAGAAPDPTPPAPPGETGPVPSRNIRALTDRPSPRHDSLRKPSNGRPPAALIPLNTATVDELDRLPGIGPVLAKRMVDYRERRRREGHRGFESKDELLNVSGIGPKRYAGIRDLVTL